MIAQSDADVLEQQDGVTNLADLTNMLVDDAEGSLADLSTALEDLSKDAALSAAVNSKVNLLEDKADLDKIADSIDDVVGSLSTT